MEVVISELKKYEIDEVADLLANSMCNNPNHLAIFKSNNETVIKKQQQMFKMLLQNSNNKCFVARLNGQIVGSMSYTTSNHCQLSLWELFVSLPKFIAIFGSNIVTVLKWRMNWAKHDCKNKHIHFGPIAVHTNHQGKGVGKALMTHFCKYIDTTFQIAYLETDKVENVSLYVKYGFNVTETDTLFGNTNWFMLRVNNN
ncbi:MAG: GNAT family N-acetyltransferase [Bacteroidota bacterium]